MGLCNTTIWSEAGLNDDDRLGELIVVLTKIKLRFKTEEPQRRA